MMPSIGIEGILELEFIGYFVNQRYAFRKISIFRQTSDASYFVPVDVHRATQSYHNQLSGTIARRLVWLWINRNQNPFHQQILGFHNHHLTVRSLEVPIWGARKTLDGAEQIH